MSLLADNAPVSSGMGGWGRAASRASSESWALLTMESSGFPGQGKQQQHPYGAVGVFHLFVCLKWVGGGMRGGVNDRFRQRISPESGHFLLLRSFDS